MKKIILISSLFLLIGAGCAGVQKDTTDTDIKNTPEKTGISEPIDNRTPEEKEVGFKVHYPEYIPDGFNINKDNLYTIDQNGIDKAVYYKLEKTEDGIEKFIAVQETKNKMSAEERSQLTNVEDIPELLEGISLKTNFKSVPANHVIFTTRDGRTIQLSTEYFDTELLITIAKSMDK